MADSAVSAVNQAGSAVQQTLVSNAFLLDFLPIVIFLVIAKPF